MLGVYRLSAAGRALPLLRATAAARRCLQVATGRWPLQLPLAAGCWLLAAGCFDLRIAASNSQTQTPIAH
jgi:hypothetical protein